jgi:hypothetical protein
VGGGIFGAFLSPLGVLVDDVVNSDGQAIAHRPGPSGAYPSIVSGEWRELPFEAVKVVWVWWLTLCDFGLRRGELHKYVFIRRSKNCLCTGHITIQSPPIARRARPPSTSAFTVPSTAFNLQNSMRVGEGDTQPHSPCRLPDLIPQRGAP